MAAPGLLHGPDFQLTDRVALVTGAGQGIGRAVAEALAAAGARVVMADRNAGALAEAADELQSRGAVVTGMELDVADPEAGSRAVLATVARYGRLDVLVNNAGINIVQPSLAVTADAWDRVLGVNLRGLFFLCQAAARQMSTGGAIVNIASQLGLVGSAGRAAYTASKGGVVNLTRTLASEWAPIGIRVNAVAPGPVDTPLTQYLSADPESYASLAGRIPLGRFGKPEEIAGAVVFLASSAAAFVTGHTLVVDGGYSII